MAYKINPYTGLLDEVGSSGGTWGSITGTLSNQTDLQTQLDNKQPLDSDLTQIAGLSVVNDAILQRKLGTWSNRTPTQIKTDMALNNVDNTSDLNKPISTATQTALDLKSDLPNVHLMLSTYVY